MKELKYKKIVFIISTIITIFISILFSIYWDKILEFSKSNDNLNLGIVEKIKDRNIGLLLLLIFSSIFNILCNRAGNKYYSKGINKLFTQYPIDGERKVFIKKIAAYILCFIVPINNLILLIIMI